MSIPNYYTKLPKQYIKKIDNPNKQKHNMDLHFRMCVSAPSGSGKSNFLYHFLHQLDGTFDKIFLITRNKDEPLYNHLEDKSKNRIVIKEGMENIPNLDDFDKDENNMVIFDDLVTAKNQTPIINYYIRCRKRGCSVIYLSQSYFDIPKMIRKNSNYAVFLKLGGQREIKTILSDYSLQVSKDQLFKMFDFATKEKFQTFIIDADSADMKKKFRRGLLEYLDPDDFEEKKEEE